MKRRAFGLFRVFSSSIGSPVSRVTPGRSLFVSDSLVGKPSLRPLLLRQRATVEDLKLGLKKEFHDALVSLRKAQLEALNDLGRAKNKTVALLNSLTLSSSGQHILGHGTPFLAASILAPKWASCYSLATMPLNPINDPYPKYQPTSIVTAITKEIGLWIRAAYLWLIFMPAIVSAPICLCTGFARAYWMTLMRWTLEMAGPAFIKWGQWSATRPDLFPKDLCKSLERLHHHAPVHSFRDSRAEVESVFGLKLEEIFSDFDEDPVASGSIAQVHKAKLRDGMGGVLSNTDVAVKVRHPGVSSLIKKDFELMIRACHLASQLPGISELRLEESIRQFRGPMQEQVDLTCEARNLQRFIRNFRFHSRVNFPIPLYPLVRPSVLVETFEEGDSIDRLIEHPAGQTSIRVSEIGLDMYLKMLVSDNFVHADLHPGNILIKRPPDARKTWQGWFQDVFGMGRYPKLILLDAGMVTELAPQDQFKLVGFFKALTERDGENIAQSILSLSEQPLCPNPSAFVEDMKDLFDNLDVQTIKKYSTEVIQDMLGKVRTHQVNLKGSVSTLVATTLVLEGWSTRLNPDISIMEQIGEALPKGADDRMMSTVEKIASMSSLAEL